MQGVITVRWVKGCRVDDHQALQQLSIRPRDAAALLLDTFAEMTYVHGFVHADPHPGNVLVRPAPCQGALTSLPLKQCSHAYIQELSQTRQATLYAGIQRRMLEVKCMA